MRQLILEKLLSDVLEEKGDLIEFAKECLKRIYSNQFPLAEQLFLESLEYREDMGCLQSLDCIDHNLKRMADERKKFEETKTIQL